MAKRWYSVSVLSNYEKKIAETIRQSAIDSNMEEKIEEVLVPTEEIIEVRRGKKSDYRAPLHAGLCFGADGIV